MDLARTAAVPEADHDLEAALRALRNALSRWLIQTAL
jgi:hypothetical protein